MKNIFSVLGKGELKTFFHQNTIYCFDFDGTLAEIIDNPSQVFLKPKTRELLKKLQTKKPIAVISGRSVADLKGRLGFEPNFLIGNHGIEGLFTEKNFLEECKKTTKKWLQKISELSKISMNKFNYDIEDKDFSICIHYKNKHHISPEEIANTTNLISMLDPIPKIIHGKSVLNILPNFNINKGTSLLEIMKKSQFSHAVYIGDDITDEDVFKLNMNNILTIRIGKKTESNAKYFIQEQTKIDKFISEILLTQ